MNDRLTQESVGRVVRDCVAGFPRDECRTCDCFQGYLTQLEIDATEDVSDIVGPFKVTNEEMHACLGCDPCPPGTTFSEHLKKSWE